MTQSAPRIDAIPKQNLIINGNFDFWQRGTSFTTPANGAYVADRVAIHSGGLTVGSSTISRSTDVPNKKSAYSLSYVVNTPFTVDSSTGYTSISHKIEGSNSRLIYDKNASLSFYIKSSVVGNYYVSVKTGGAPAAFFTSKISVPNTLWNKYTIDLGKVDTTIGAGWEINENFGLRVQFILQAGTTYHTTTVGSWGSSSAASLAASDINTSFLTTSGATFLVSQVMLNEGSVAHDFSLAGGTIGGELALCQRYYEKRTSLQIGGGCSTAETQYPYIPFAVNKRTAAHTLTITNGSLLNVSSASAYTSVKTDHGFQVQITTSGAGRFFIGNNNDAIMTCDAEL